MMRSTLASSLLLMLLATSAHAFCSPVGIRVKHTPAISRSTNNNYQPLYSTSEWQGKGPIPSSSVNQPKTTSATVNKKMLKDRRGPQRKTLLRVVVPSLLIGITACLTFPAVSMMIASLIHDAGAFSVLSQDSSQFVQNFLNVAGLLFSILVGQTCK